MVFAIQMAGEKEDPPTSGSGHVSRSSRSPFCSKAFLLLGPMWLPSPTCQERGPGDSVQVN